MGEEKGMYVEYVHLIHDEGDIKPFYLQCKKNLHREMPLNYMLRQRDEEMSLSFKSL